MFILFVTSILLLLSYRTGIRIIGPFGLSGSVKWLAWAGAIIPPLFMPAYFISRMMLGRSGSTAMDAVSWVGFTLIGLYAMIMLMVLARDIGWIAWFIAGKAAALAGAGWANPHGFVEHMTGRAVMLTNAAILALAIPLTAIGFWQAVKDPGVEEVEIGIKGLPAEFNGFTIAQVTDFHAGPTIKRDRARVVVDLANSLKPDLVAVTGDMVDEPVESIGQELEPFKDLKAKYGVYFVPGNHEYYSGLEGWLKRFRELGMRVLLN
jgi:hypothetical protein